MPEKLGPADFAINRGDVKFFEFVLEVFKVGLKVCSTSVDGGLEDEVILLCNIGVAEGHAGLLSEFMDGVVGSIEVVGGTVWRPV
jgi:hypothetical protein